jgi:photosystem II stability/assembly factor-like uncharacterized protein
MQGGTLFHTNDGGTTWTQLAANSDSPYSVLWDVQFVDQNHGYAVGFNYGSAGGPPVWRTSDGGTTWEQFFLDHDGEGLFAVAITGNRASAVGDHDYVSVSINPWGPPPGLLDPSLFTSRYTNNHCNYSGIQKPHSPIMVNAAFIEKHEMG